MRSEATNRAEGELGVAKCRKAAMGEQNRALKIFLKKVRKNEILHHPDYLPATDLIV
jgi:hypothetical protein